MTQAFLLGIPGGSSNSDTSVKKMSKNALVGTIFFWNPYLTSPRAEPYCMLDGVGISAY